MEEGEIDKLFDDLVDRCLKAIEEDLGQPLNLDFLIILDVEHDGEAGVIHIVYDYPDVEDDS